MEKVIGYFKAVMLLFSWNMFLYKLLILSLMFRGLFLLS